MATNIIALDLAVMNDIPDRTADTIGKGTYATIYKTNIKRIVVKVPKTHNTYIEGLEESSIVETDILLRVSHPNVISAINIIEFADGFSIYMEEADMNLMSWINSISKLDFGTPIKSIQINIAFQIVCGLCYLHKNNIIHQDLKPENVLLYLLEDRINIKLCDFGMSTIAINEENRYAEVQSIGYRAPELLLAKSDTTYTKKIDIWSLGIICYELIAFQKPFHDVYNFKAYVGAFKNKDMLSLMFLRFDPLVRDFILKMLEVDPCIRWSADKLMDHDLFMELTKEEGKYKYMEIKKVKISPIGIFSYPHVRKEVLLYSYEVNKNVNKQIDKNTIKFYQLQAWYLSVNILDRFCSTINILDIDTLKVCAVSSLFLASKIYYFVHKRLEDFLPYKNNDMDKYTFINKVLKFEKEIFKSLGYMLYRPPLTLIFPNATEVELKNYLINNHTTDEIYG